MKLTKKQLVTKAKCLEALKNEQYNDDTEMAHSNADDYLCDLLNELGMNDVVEEYSNIDKWYA